MPLCSAMTSTNGGCRFVSWNVKRINGTVKRGRVHIQHLKGDIIFLQEPHFKSSDVSRIKSLWMDVIFYSKISRGAAIIISKDVAFELSKVVKDPNGSVVAASGRLFNTRVILASIYAPVWDDVRFITHLSPT